MICPKCNSENVTINVVSETRLVEKRHGVFWWIFVGWWWLPFKWLFLTVPALIVKIFSRKRKKLDHKEKTVCVCQSCGNKWEIN